MSLLNPNLIPSYLKSLIEKVSGIEDLERSVFIQSLHAIDKVNHLAAAELAARRFAKPRRWAPPEAELALAKEGTQVEYRCGLVGHRFGSGKAVLLVHGWGGRGLQLGALIEPLVEKGFSVIALDGPAHGESPGSWTSPTHFATFLKTVSLEIGPLKGLVAHSFGAGSSILALESGLEAERAILVAPANNYGSLLVRYCDAMGLSPEARHIFAQLITYKLGIPAKDFLLSTYFARVRQETLLIHDKNDKELASTESEQLVLANPRSKLVLTEGLGHRRILKSDVFVKRSLDFIGS